MANHHQVADKMLKVISSQHTCTSHILQYNKYTPCTMLSFQNLHRFQIS